MRSCTAARTRAAAVSHAPFGLKKKKRKKKRKRKRKRRRRLVPCAARGAF